MGLTARCIAPYLLFLGLAWIMFPSTSPATTFHVAQTSVASDENDGSEAHPWRTITRSVRTARPGDTVLIHPGTYREWVAPKFSGTRENPITFKGTDRDAVIITGADLITDWQRVPGEKPIYRHAPWNTQFESDDEGGKPVYHYPIDDEHILIGRAEQVIVDQALLEQVLTLDELQPGCFFADLDQKALYLWLANDAAPTEHEVEASTRGWVFGGDPWSKKGLANYIHLQDITIRYAANHAQSGALYVVGDGWQIDGVTVEWTNGCGASFVGADLLVRDFCSRHNGQIGMGGQVVAGEFTDIQLLDNNRKGYDAQWEAGGMKFALCRDLVISRVEAARNQGPGIWFDVDNRDCIIRQCVAYDNAGHGIYVEISGGFVITNNLCYNNGSNGNWAGGGICIAESTDCLLEHNTCVGNPTGISVREQGPRLFEGRYREEAYHVRNFVSQYNLCAFNTEYQFGFWSDNAFFDDEESVGEDEEPPLDPALYGFRIDHNLYFAGEDQGLVLWGCTWRSKHKEYEKLKSFTEEQGHDRHSAVGDPLFLDWPNRDFRLMSRSPAKVHGVGVLNPR